jgi:hypothetical protein
LEVAGWELDASCRDVHQARRARRAHAGHWPWAEEPRDTAHACEEDGQVPCAVLCVDEPMVRLRRLPSAP